MRYCLILLLGVFLSGCTMPITVWAYHHGKKKGYEEAQKEQADNGEGARVPETQD